MPSGLNISLAFKMQLFLALPSINMKSKYFNLAGKFT